MMVGESAILTHHGSREERIMGDTPLRAMPDPVAEPFITVPRAAAIATCPLRTAYRQVESGAWPSIRLGRRAVRIPTAKWLRLVGLVDEEAA